MDRDRLIELFRQRGMRFGDFTLASGRKSSYYLDKMHVTLRGETLRMVCQGLLELAADFTFDAVGGMVIGADPLVGGMLSLSALESHGGRDLIGVLVRKEAKGHGTQNFIEGPLEPGMRVLVVEDVVTTGGSSLKAIERLQDFGAEIAGVLAIVDRLEGGREAFEAAGHRMQSLLTIRDFGIEPPSPEER